MSERKQKQTERLPQRHRASRSGSRGEEARGAHARDESGERSARPKKKEPSTVPHEKKEKTPEKERGRQRSFIIIDFLDLVLRTFDPSPCVTL